VNTCLYNTNFSLISTLKFFNFPELYSNHEPGKSFVIDGQELLPKFLHVLPVFQRIGLNQPGQSVLQSDAKSLKHFKKVANRCFAHLATLTETLESFGVTYEGI
jgi:hypothetical protein